MITFIKKLTKVGNSKGFIIDSAIIKSENFEIDKLYKVTIEAI